MNHQDQNQKQSKSSGSRRVILRLVIWGVVLVLLLGSFITLMLGGNLFGLRFDQLKLVSCGTDYWYDDSGYEVGNTDVAEAIRELSVDWLDGGVTVTSDPALETLTVREKTQDGDAPDDDNALRWKLSGGKLTVRAYKPRKIAVGTNGMHKELEIVIPTAWLAELRSIKLNTVSGDVSLRLEETDAQLDSLDVDTVSGAVELNCAAKEASVDTTSGNITLDGRFDELSVDTVSGKISLEGYADELELDSTSGNMTVTLYRAARKLEADTVSGNLILTLPADTAGFTATLDSVSGDVEIQEFAITHSKHTYTFGDGSMQIEMDSTSGDLTIRKGS